LLFGFFLVVVVGFFWLFSVILEEIEAKN